MPLSETAESQKDKQEKMKMLSKETNVNNEEIGILVQSTYYSQHKEINKGASMKQLFQDWPFVFQEIGMGVHFKQLTGIDLKEMFFASLDKKRAQLLKFLKTTSTERKKQVMRAAAKLEVSRGQLEGGSKDVKDMVILLLAYFEERQEVMFHHVEESFLAEDVVDKLPVTPCIIVSALCMMFGSFYCFNIHYLVELASTLEFLQRCFFNINPDKKQLPINPKVLTLIADLADHDWRTSS
ncbi:uncharacterized protein LOC120537715 [Polypterus senegalus]|uniref:uncharacterized protein LOC120537715 n=1 Tax=Polypterus senegalus TaxID=55291 RepID=UPI001963F3B7|nr:uncharacterized protein LOC120537715 [Polypterus senegalus]XP_039622796.1 uncharacterized protein LOC120537715 [Polypterus senegalus]